MSKKRTIEREKEREREGIMIQTKDQVFTTRLFQMSKVKFLSSGSKKRRGLFHVHDKKEKPARKIFQSIAVILVIANRVKGREVRKILLLRFFFNRKKRVDEEFLVWRTSIGG